MKHLYSFIFLCIFTTVLISSDANLFYQLISDYENKIDDAAIAWLDKNYGRALDQFKSAKELLAKSVFSSTEGFEFEACQSLQSYTLVLARIAEAQMYHENDQIGLSDEITSQANLWAEKLLVQGKSWYKIKTLDEKEIRFRQKWLSRYRSAIMKAKKLLH